MSFVGKVNGSGQPASLIYVGNGTNLRFVLDTVYENFEILQELGSCNVWKATSEVSARSEKFDISAIDLPWPYEVHYKDDRNVLEIPAWIRQELVFEFDWSNTVANFHRNVRGAQMRKIRKYKLGYRTTVDRTDIDHFYDQFYVSHVKRRFGADAQVETRFDIRSAASAGALLQVLRDGDVIAGSVLLPEDAALRMLFIGFSATDLRTIDGASAALYYFTLKHAFDEGYKSVDFCGSRPLLDDGVLRFKRSWGAAVHDDWALETLLLQINNSEAATTSFLASHPLVVRQQDKLIGKVFVNSGPLDAATAKKIVHNMTNPGLDFLVLYCAYGFSNDCDDALAASDVAVRLIDLSDRPDPVAAYCDEPIS